MKAGLVSKKGLVKYLIAVIETIFTLTIAHPNSARAGEYLLWLKAEAGSAQAQTDLGLACANGHGVSQLFCEPDFEYSVKRNYFREVIALKVFSVIV